MILLLGTPGQAAVAALLGHCVGDLSAALFGPHLREKRRAVRGGGESGKTVEGSAAYVVAALFATSPLLVFERLPLGVLPWIAGALGGAAVERFCGDLDDDFPAPIAYAAVITAILWIAS